MRIFYRILVLSLIVTNPALAAANAPPITTDNSVAVLSQGARSVSGLTNALAFACGVAINDGNPHTVATAPAGSCFSGITTLAGLAGIQINGGTPFAFLTDDGSITGPACSYGSTANCFTAPTGAWKLTNASVANIDLAWLAIQAALLTQKAYIPSGKYLIGTAAPLPLMIPVVPQFVANSQASIVQGDGPASTILRAGSSFGTLGDADATVIPLMSCGDAGATPENTLGRWNGANGTCVGKLSGMSLYGNPSLATGLASSYSTDGLAWGARLEIQDFYSISFYHDVTITGDHTLFTNLQAQGGIYGLYWTPPNSALSGDLTFNNLSAAGATFAALDVDGAASIVGTAFEGETYINAGLYDIYGETNGCADIIFDAHIVRLMTEFGALGVMEDGHNFSNGVYTDSNKCRSVHNVIIDRWFNQYNNGFIAAQPGPSSTWRRRRATIDVYQVSGKIMGLSITGGGFIPVADNVGPAGIAMINVQAIEDASYGIYLDLEGDLPNIFLEGVAAGSGGGTIPVLNASASGGIGYLPADGVRWSAPGGQGGSFAVLSTRGSYTSTAAGDVMENIVGGYGGVAPAGYAISQPIAGIAAQSGLTNGQVVPLITTGEARVATGYHTGSDGFEMKSTGIGGRTTIVPGIGGTNGTYTITATGGGCTTEPVFSVTVAAGSIDSVSVANAASVTGCTAVPSVSTSVIGGLSGGSITPQWPSANAVAATSEQSGVIVGFGKSVEGGSLAAGTGTYLTQLLMVH